MWHVGLAKITRHLSGFHCFVEWFKVSNILAAQVHSGWDKGRMGDAISSKIVLDNKKPLKKILLSQMLTCDGFTD